MSVNPLNTGAAPAEIAAIIAQELATLAADAQTLATQLLPGDVVPAVVLPSNGLTDLLSVNGLRVAAELPPTLLPGENITVMVTGFAGERINLQIVPAPPGANATLPTANGLPTTPAAKATAAKASPPTTPAANAAPPATPATKAASPSARAAQGEASPTPGAQKPASPAGARPPTGLEAAVAVRNSGSVPRASGSGEYGPRSAPAQVPAELHTIEARLAAAHATAPTPVTRPPAAPVTPPPAVRPAIAIRQPPNPVLPPARPPAPGGQTQRPFGANPRLDLGRPPLPAGAAGPRSPIGQPLSPPSAAAAAIAPRAAAARGPAAFNEPAALLRALNLPATPANLAAARMALESPEKIPAALANLERALAGHADPRVATLSALTSFIARIDPKSPVLAAQVAAFVDHVVTGREAKFAQLARAVDDPELSESAKNSGPDLEPQTPQTKAVPVGAARIAVARASLDYDFKTQLLAVASGRAAGADGAPTNATVFDRAIAGTLSAITALQLNAASTLNAHPEGLAFTVPIALPNGFANAHVRIDREAPGVRRTPLDGDNFHIAFVLETRRLGTVAIDVMTVGRAVTLSVKTEAVLAQQVFSRTLDRLSARLESLGYRVAHADAAVAPPAVSELPPQLAPPPIPPADSARLVDVDA